MEGSAWKSIENEYQFMSQIQWSRGRIYKNEILDFRDDIKFFTTMFFSKLLVSTKIRTWNFIHEHLDEVMMMQIYKNEILDFRDDVKSFTTMFFNKLLVSTKIWTWNFFTNIMMKWWWCKFYFSKFRWWCEILHDDVFLLK